MALVLPAVLPWLVALDLALFGACLADLFLTPRPDRLAVERTLPRKVGLSRPFERVVALGPREGARPAAARRAAGLRVELHEELPAGFVVAARTLEGRSAPPAADDPSGGEDSGTTDGAGRLVLRRTLRAERRGVFAVGDLRVRVRGRLGLLARQRRLYGSQELAVEPALANLRRALSLAASERWQDLGVRLLRRRGGETEFESLREYVAGDEVRRVDWKAFARRGKPIVRDYEVERGQELLLLIDRGRRMRAVTDDRERPGWTKLDFALDAALELAAVALSKGDRVGVATFARGLEGFVPPAKTSRQLLRLSQALFALQPTEEEGDLGQALRELAARHRRRATVVVLSDVADPLSTDAQRRALIGASRRHRVVFAALDDPGVRAAAVGEGASALERAGALELENDRRRALRRLRTSGARVLDALPAEAAGPLLSAWLDERRRA